ncbi:MAG: dATP/dGTP diphosphohydrolase domain-containing protein [Pseudomonadota bacterium]|nr:dATP/dGTP diphosphohydrolase domain-containing protein [Pseudomonadota bacterium]
MTATKEHYSEVDRLGKGSPTRGDRHNAGKPKLSLVLEAPNALAGIASVLEDGIAEYGRKNWKKGLLFTEILDSLIRHTVAYNNGEDLDPKSGKHHTYHIGCNALFLAEMITIHPELDDREVVHEEAKG